MTESVTDIIAKLADIEEMAIRIVESAEDEKKELNVRMDDRISKYDEQLKLSIEKKIQAIKEKLDKQLQDEITKLEKETEQDIDKISKLYNTNRIAWEDSIFESIIEV